MKKKIIFILLMIVSIFGIINVKAETKNIELTKIDVLEKSSTITVVEPVISNNEITSSITFNQVDDYVEFKLTLKNNETDKIKITNISDNLENENIKIDYTYDNNNFIESGKEATINVKMTYKTKLVNEDKTIDNLILTLTLEKENGEKQDSDIIVNPTTGDNILRYVLLLVISVIGLGLLFTIKNKKTKLTSLLVILGLIMVPAIVYAEEKYEATIKYTNIVIKGEFEEYTVTFDTDGGTEIASQTVKYGEKATRPDTDPEKEDYEFVDWYTDSFYNTIFDFDEAIYSDTVIFGAFKKSVVSPDNLNITRLTDYKSTENESVVIDSNVVCKRAIRLHEETCLQTNPNRFCSSDGYTENGSQGTTTITYGSFGTQGGNLVIGDAFTCDVNGDKIFDEESERFYYVSDYYNTKTKEYEDDTAVLVYYNSVSNGMASNTMRADYSNLEDIQAIDQSISAVDNIHGPVTLIKELPTTNQWPNVSLKNNNRAILAANNNLDFELTSTVAGELPTNFSYEGYAARFLTVKEFFDASGDSYDKIYNNVFFLENSYYSTPSINQVGMTFETPMEEQSNKIWIIHGAVRKVYSNSVTSSIGSVRPVIEVPKSKISY